MRDIRWAVEASAKSIGVSWGYQSVEMLILPNADLIVYSPKALMDIFIGSQK
jgi:phosphoglycolate phosphatase-like HAD superfamily hydrolase